MMDEKKVRRFVGVVAAVVILGAVIFIVNLSTATVDISWAVVAAIIVVSIGIFAFFSIRRSMKDLKSGFPMDDEMSKAIKMRAGYLAFFISMYLLFAMGFIYSMVEDSLASQLPTSELLMVYVAVMGTIFLLANYYYKRKGVPA